MESEAQSPNEYEEARNKRIAENNAKLESLGIFPRSGMCCSKLHVWEAPGVGDMEVGRFEQLDVGD